MYRQQTIDFDDLRSGIDDMFSVKPKVKPVVKPEPVPSEVFCERYTEYAGEVRDWLMTMPTAVGKPFSAHRVIRSLGYAGKRIYKTPAIEMPAECDVYDWAQRYVDDSGGCMELRNADGEIVAKFVPDRESVNFI